jgi:hypothetical protein
MRRLYVYYTAAAFITPVVRFQGDVTRANKTIGASSRGAAGLMGTYCASNPCKNGGRCVDNSHAAPGYFTCFCPPNFQGLGFILGFIVGLFRK